MRPAILLVFWSAVLLDAFRGCRWWLVWTFLNEITNDYITYCLPSEASWFLVPRFWFLCLFVFMSLELVFAQVEWWLQVHGSYDRIVIAWTKIWCYELLVHWFMVVHWYILIVKLTNYVKVESLADSNSNQRIPHLWFYFPCQ